MKIYLIRNYLPDKQESMKRFADMLETGFSEQDIKVINWTPIVVFGTFFKTTATGLGKWFGYIDKWILFPLVLRLRILKNSSDKNTYYHICDHSNSPYLKHLPYNKAGITCHDVLAIRGALGYADAYCPASSFGKILQKWILKNLERAKYLACVSQLTYKQLCELLPGINTFEKKWMVIQNAFNADFAPLITSVSTQLLTNAGININTPYILHVGSSLQRKNRKLLVDMVADLSDKWNGNICFAGQPIDDTLKQYIENKKLDNRVLSVIKPDHKTLTALYSCCDAFIFPSFSEGFGWPVIEAQACGVPVIASNVEPMPEVSGGAAIHINPNDAQAFAAAFLSLKNKDVKDALIKDGFENVKKFSLSAITRKYIHLYKPASTEIYVS